MKLQFSIFLFVFFSLGSNVNLEASVFPEKEDHLDDWKIFQKVRTSINGYYNQIYRKRLFNFEIEKKKIASFYRLDKEISIIRKEYNLYKEDLEQLDFLMTKTIVWRTATKESSENKLLIDVLMPEGYESYGQLRQDRFRLSYILTKTEKKLGKYEATKESYKRTIMTPKKIFKYMKIKEEEFVLSHKEAHILYYIRGALNSEMTLKSLTLRKNHPQIPKNRRANLTNFF